MASALIEVSGPDAEARAAELRAALNSGAQAGERVAPVEVDRSAELVVAVIGLVFSGVGVAKTIWDWWHPQRTEPVVVKIMLTDGVVLDLAGLGQQQLEAELARRAQSRE